MNSKGWECPKCGRVYAPFVQDCAKCNADTKPSAPKDNDKLTIEKLKDLYETKSYPTTYQCSACRRWFSGGHFCVGAPRTDRLDVIPHGKLFHPTPYTYQNTVGHTTGSVTYCSHGKPANGCADCYYSK